MTDKKITPNHTLSTEAAVELSTAGDATVSRARKLHLPPHKFFRFQRVRHPVKLLNVWQLAGKTCLLLWQNRRLLLGIAIVYSLLSVLFVHGLSNSGDVQSVKRQFLTGQIGLGFSSFTTLFANSTGSSSAAAGVYQVILGVIVSLATIWALRQTTAGERPRIRDAFYKSMTPFVPFFLVLMVILIQLLPFLIGGAVYNIVVTYGIAITTSEKTLWGLLFLALTIISLYMICSSLFGLYIVTLPDMTPLRALRSARQLVRYRRLTVFRKLLFLPLAMGIAGVVIMLPIILLVPIIAQWAFFLLGIVGLVILHAYLYSLYRELLA